MKISGTMHLWVKDQDFGKVTWEQNFIMDKEDFDMSWLKAQLGDGKGEAGANTSLKFYSDCSPVRGASFGIELIASVQCDSDENVIAAVHGYLVDIGLHGVMANMDKVKEAAIGWRQKVQTEATAGLPGPY